MTKFKIPNVGIAALVPNVLVIDGKELFSEIIHNHRDCFGHWILKIEIYL
jgi:hypothetical protein